MGIEALMVKEATGLLIRRPDKLKHTFGLYLISLVDYEVSRTGRAAYFFTRYMDDLLDGDRQLPDGVEPLPHIAAIRSQVETGNFTGEPEIMKLAEYSLNALTRKARPGDNPRQDFLDVIDIMVFDNQRLQGRQSLTAEQLAEYYRRTFFPVHNIMLIGLGSSLRASDIPEFSLCQGRVYSVEHLQADWRAGIINIPTEILGAAKLTPDSPYQEVTKSPNFKNWAQDELQESKAALFSVQSKFPLSEKLACRIYNNLTRSMLKFIDRYSQIQSKQSQRG